MRSNAEIIRDYFDKIYADEMAVRESIGESKGTKAGEEHILFNAMFRYTWTKKQTFDFFGIPEEDRQNYKLGWF